MTVTRETAPPTETRVLMVLDSFNFGGAENEDPGSINILRVAYNPTPEVRINVGAIQPTFTLDDSTSSNDITFLERASVVNTVIGEYGGSDARKGIEATYLKQGEKMDWMVNVAYTTSPIGTERELPRPYGMMQNVQR